ncbi:MAG: glycosyltransferase family 2 protein [Erythrobacter sp.]
MLSAVQHALLLFAGIFILLGALDDIVVDLYWLRLLDLAIGAAELVQLPIRPLAQPGQGWIGSLPHEEFAEAHAKDLIVRATSGAALPANSGGFACAREALARLAQASPSAEPFPHMSLAEDYELGLRLAATGGSASLVRVRSADGTLVATRRHTSGRIDEAVRLKARAIRGIALEGWDRLGWQDGGREASLAEKWMRLRDRRAPLTALVLLAAYLALALNVVAWLVPNPASDGSPLSGNLAPLLAACAAALLWRAGMRLAFTARECVRCRVPGRRAMSRPPIRSESERRGQPLVLLAVLLSLWLVARVLSWAPAAEPPATKAAPTPARPAGRSSPPPPAASVPVARPMWRESVAPPLADELPVAAGHQLLWIEAMAREPAVAAGECNPGPGCPAQSAVGER